MYKVINPKTTGRSIDQQLYISWSNLNLGKVPLTHITVNINNNALIPNTIPDIKAISPIKGNDDPPNQSKLVMQLIKAMLLYYAKK